MPDHSFLPRVLGKRASLAHPNSSTTPHSRLVANGSSDEATPLSLGTHAPGSSRLPSNEELVATIDLMLSEHAQWLNPELRSEIENFSADGYIPLSKLFALSPPLTTWPLDAKIQRAIITSIRANNVANARYDVRMVMSEPEAYWTTHEFPASSSKRTLQTADAGGYEIRRKSGPSSVLAMQNLKDLMERTVYIENIPLSLKTAPKIAYFIQTQLSQSPTLITSHSAEVQWVAFAPPRAIRGETLTTSDDHGPRDSAKFQGFAFVTLREASFAESILRAWPWDRTVASDSEDASVIDARRAGFRSLSLEDWVSLRDEYLHCQKALSKASDSLRPSDTDHHQPLKEPDGGVDTNTANPATYHAAASSPSITINSEPSVEVPSYPPGCLVFVRNIHTQTNKTTLKQMLSHAFSTSPVAEDVFKGKEVDYVDYQKNMDACHVRLSQASLSERLQEYFREQDRYQNSPLDDTASDSSNGVARPIVVEVVSGLKEEIYWMQLPEKVRLEALRKAGYVVTKLDEPARDVRKRRRKG